MDKFTELAIPQPNGVRFKPAPAESSAKETVAADAPKAAEPSAPAGSASAAPASSLSVFSPKTDSSTADVSSESDRKASADRFSAPREGAGRITFVSESKTPGKPASKPTSEAAPDSVETNQEGGNAPTLFVGLGKTATSCHG